MKRWVKAQYIPDMTERYPEGQGFVDYPDDIPLPDLQHSKKL